MSRNAAVRVALLLAALIVLTRWPLIPHEHLYHIDNVNFALALDEFNPSLHRPQPPGDPLYVALSKLLRLFVSRPETLFPVTGLLGSLAALLVCWRLGTLLFGRFAGWAAAMLLAFNPVFWLAGVGNYVRVFLAWGGLTVALLVWRCWNAPPETARIFFWASAGALGLAAGFRPEAGILLLPLAASSIWIRRFTARDILFAVCFLAAATLPWLAITAYKTGGFIALYRLNSRYLAEQSRNFSLFYGATARQAITMAAASLYWTFLGAVSWIWAAPFAFRGFALPAMRKESRLLAIWFLPPFLFHTFVHIQNPDHALTEIPAVCILGAFIVSRLAPAIPRTPRAIWNPAPLILLLTAINVALFFYPKGSPFWASNYGIARYTIEQAGEVYEHLPKLDREAHTTVLWKDAFITPQEMNYYFPRIPVVDLGNRGSLLVRTNNTYRPLPSSDGEYVIQPGIVAWLEPVPVSERAIFAALGTPTRAGPFQFVKIEAGQRFEVGGFRFVAR